MSFAYRRYPRLMIISGAVENTLGVLLASVATNSAQLAVSFSLAGWGLCILLVSGLNELARLTDDNFGFFLGLGFAGYPVGMFLVPLIGDFLMEVYGWRGAMLIIGGLMAHAIPLAMVIKPQTEGSSGKTVTRNTERQRYHSLSDVENAGHRPQKSDNIKQQQSVRRFSKCDDHDRSVNKISSKDQMSDREGTIQVESSIEVNQDEDRSDDSQENDITGRGEKSVNRRFDRLILMVKQSDFYTKPGLTIFIVLTFLHGITYASWHAFLIPRAVERGMPVLQAITLSLCAGLANFVGRLTVGVIADRFGRIMTIFIFFTFLMAVSLLCDVTTCNFVATYVITVISAFSIASRANLTVVVIKHKASKEYCDIAMAMQVFCAGFGTMLGAYLAGAVADQFGSYNDSFIALFCVEILLFLLLCPITGPWCWGETKERRDRPSSPSK